MQSIRSLIEAYEIQQPHFLETGVMSRSKLYLSEAFWVKEGSC